MDEVAIRSQRETNGLGLAGFVLSLVGLCSGGVLSPIGLILSLIAVGKEPRGFAIAGIVLGALGSCGIIVTVLVAPLIIVGVLLAAGAAGAAVAVASALGGPELTAFVEQRILDGMVEDYVHDNGALPPTLGEVVPPKLRTRLTTDPWDRPYILEPGPDGMTWRIYSTGADGVAGTADDIDEHYFEGGPQTPTPSPDAAPSEPPAPEEPAVPHRESEPQ